VSRRSMLTVSQTGVSVAAGALARLAKAAPLEWTPRERIDRLAHEAAEALARVVLDSVCRHCPKCGAEINPVIPPPEP
jgi:hypothetical protein